MPFGGDPSRSPSHDYRGDDDPYTSDGQPVGANNRPATDSIDHQLAVGQRPRYAGERADDRQGQRSARVTVHPMLSAPCKAMGPVTALQGVLRMEACKAGETCPKRVTLVTEEKTWHLGIDPHFNAQRGRRVQLRGRACSDGEHFESASMTPLK